MGRAVRHRFAQYRCLAENYAWLGRSLLLTNEHQFCEHTFKWWWSTLNQIVHMNLAVAQQVLLPRRTDNWQEADSVTPVAKSHVAKCCLIVTLACFCHLDARSLLFERLECCRLLVNLGQSLLVGIPANAQIICKMPLTNKLPTFQYLLHRHIPPFKDQQAPFLVVGFCKFICLHSNLIGLALS